MKAKKKIPGFSKWLAKQSLPNDIDSSEYRAIYEVLESVGKEDSKPDPDDFELANGILAEFIGHASALRADLRRHLKGR